MMSQLLLPADLQRNLGEAGRAGPPCGDGPMCDDEPDPARIGDAGKVVAARAGISVGVGMPASDQPVGAGAAAALSVEQVLRIDLETAGRVCGHVGGNAGMPHLGGGTEEQTAGLVRVGGGGGGAQGVGGRGAQAYLRFPAIGA